MKEQNGKLSRDEFLSFVKAVLKKKSLEENKPLYFEYRLSENGEKEKFLNRFDAFAPEGFSEYRNSVIFEFIYSRTLKAEQIKKRIKGVTDTYRKSYDATIVFILNTEFQFEDSNSAVWDLSVINNWIEEYPTEYSHACSLGMERKTVASDKENIQLFEKLYSEGLYLKNNDSYTNAIRTCIKEQNGFAIVLGAGVSKEQGAKTWDELLKDFQKEMVQDKRLSTALNWYRALPFSSNKNLTKPVTVPTLFIWGKHDTAIGEKSVKLNKDYVEAPYQEVIMDATHWIPVQNAQELTQNVLGSIQ